MVDESELSPEVDILASDLGQVIHLSDPLFPFPGAVIRANQSVCINPLEKCLAYNKYLKITPDSVLNCTYKIVLRTSVTHFYDFSPSFFFS